MGDIITKSRFFKANKHIARTLDVKLTNLVADDARLAPAVAAIPPKIISTYQDRLDQQETAFISNLKTQQATAKKRAKDIAQLLQYEMLAEFQREQELEKRYNIRLEAIRANSQLTDDQKKQLWLELYCWASILHAFFDKKDDTRKAKKYAEDMRREIERKIDGKGLLPELTKTWKETLQEAVGVSNLRMYIGIINIHRIAGIFAKLLVVEMAMLSIELQWVEHMDFGFMGKTDTTEFISFIKHPIFTEIFNALSVALFLLRLALFALVTGKHTRGATKEERKTQARDRLIQDIIHNILLVANDVLWPVINGITNYPGIVSDLVAMWLTVGFLFFDVVIATIDYFVTMSDLNKQHELHQKELTQYEEWIGALERIAVSARQRLGVVPDPNATILKGDLALDQYQYIAGDDFLRALNNNTLRLSTLEQELSRSKLQRDIKKDDIKQVVITKAEKRSKSGMNIAGAATLMLGYGGRTVSFMLLATVATSGLAGAVAILMYLVCNIALGLYLSAGKFSEWRKAEQKVKEYGAGPNALQLKEDASKACGNFWFTFARNALLPMFCIAVIAASWQISLVITAAVLVGKIAYDKLNECKKKPSASLVAKTSPAFLAAPGAKPGQGPKKLADDVSEHSSDGSDDEVAGPSSDRSTPAHSPSQQ